ncbi:MAG: hypothetical protein IJU33_01315 [Bacteroidales bacterium]|nr:hypothetical protein [Bacteroidales bacterium]
MEIKVEIENQSQYAQQLYARCKILGKNSKKQFLYKYMDMDTALKCLQNSELRFAEPSSWKDQYEKLFYTADYHKVDPTKSYPKTIFACCFTKEKVNEAAWKTYIYSQSGLSGRCVQFKINRSKFRIALSKALKNNGVAYEGQCIYKQIDKEITHLTDKKSPNYSAIFGKGIDLSGFLSLLLVKRKCFRYENETRFFLDLDNKNAFKVHGRKKTGKFIYVKLNWTDFIEAIVIDERCSDMELNVLTTACHKAGIKIKPTRNDLYAVPFKHPITIP